MFATICVFVTSLFATCFELNGRQRMINSIIGISKGCRAEPQFVGPDFAFEGDVAGNPFQILRSLKPSLKTLSAVRVAVVSALAQMMADQGQAVRHPEWQDPWNPKNTARRLVAAIVKMLKDCCGVR